MRSSVAALALLAAVSSPVWGTQEAGLLPLPNPGLETAEPAVRQVIQERRAAVMEGSRLSDGERARRWGALGEAYHAHGFRPAAEVCYRNAVSLAPREARFSHLLGLLRFEAGDFEGAAQSFERAVSLHSDGISSWLRLAESRLSLGETARAEAAFERALELDPDSAAAFCGLGRLAQQRGELEAARERFESCLAQQPEATQVHASLAVLYRRLGQEEKARWHAERYGPTAVSFPDPYRAGLSRTSAQSDQYLAKGAELSRSGRDEQALQAYLQALAASPEDARVHQALGTVYERLGRLEDSLEHYRRAVDLEPSDSLSQFNVASLYARLERYEEARSGFEAVLELDPDDRDAISSLAWLQDRLGETETAAELYGRLIELEPGNRDARLRRSQSLLRLGRTEEAILELAGAAELGLADASLLLMLGSLRAQAGELGAASDDLLMALSRAPDDPLRARAHYALGLVRLRQGLDGEAREQLEAASLAAPAESGPRAMLATLLASSSEPRVRDGDRALRLARDLFAEEPTPAHAEIVAMAYAAAGDFDQAVAWQERLLEQEASSGPAAWQARLRGNLERYRVGEVASPPASGDSG